MSNYVGIKGNGFTCGAIVIAMIFLWRVNQSTSFSTPKKNYIILLGICAKWFKVFFS